MMILLRLVSRQTVSLNTGSQKTSHRQKCLNSYIPNADRLANKRTHPSNCRCSITRTQKEKTPKRMTEKTREKKEKTK